MRCLILSDIHSNLEALDAVLTAAAAQKHDAVVVLGDLVGYGADPNAVVERVRELAPMAVIRGNHDKVACGIDDARDFNAIARAAAQWTQQSLTPSAREYLRALPAGPLLVGDYFEICHGSPLDEDLYIIDDHDALTALSAARRPICLFGHTHVALAARLEEDGRIRVEMPRGHPELDVSFVPTQRYLVNPGSVGQPRDGDSRAAYAIVDTDLRRGTLFRVSYPIEIAQEKILSAGLPSMLAHRLGMGR
jgi:diadenosine tetraphosphatase ApaH/serine/threonine PP2A family protein phosphatase